MYLGVVLMFLAVPRVLGSAWTFAPVVTMTLLVMVCAVLEERLLRRDLPGYEEYMLKTRWRIVPGIWQARTPSGPVSPALSGQRTSTAKW